MAKYRPVEVEISGKKRIVEDLAGVSESRMTLHYRAAKSLSKETHQKQQPIGIGTCRLLIHIMGVVEGIDRVDRSRDEIRIRAAFGR